MGKKIILFLSKNPRPELPSEETYLCPDGKRVKGRLTNEAPILYLMEHYKGIDEAICIVTPDAKRTAWEPVQAYVHQSYPDLAFTEIPLAEGENFYQKPLQLILERVQTDDEILLETTGGFRNAVMDLLLLSRILTYGGNKTAGAVYANYQRGKEMQVIEDATPLVNMFDLVGGMQELSSFGSVNTVQQYYRRAKVPANSDFETLMTVMKRMKSQITLCNTKNLEEELQKFNQAVAAVEKSGEPIMRVLLPTFRNRFGQEMTIPSLIRWCADCGLVQQALTIYREKVPGYLLDTPEVGLSLREDAPPVAIEKDYQDEQEEKFNAGLKDLSERAAMYGGRWRKQYPDKRPNDDVLMMEYLEDVIRDSSFFRFRGKVDCLRNVIMDYYYIWALRNRVNHAESEDAKDTLRLQYICDRRHYKNIDEVNLEQVCNILDKCVANIEQMESGSKRRGK